MNSTSTDGAREAETINMATFSGAPEIEVTTEEPVELRKPVSKQSSPFLLVKCAELAIACACLGLQTETWVILLLRGTKHIMAGPFIAATTFIVYSPIFLVGHVVGSRTPKYITTAFNVVGIVLFIAMGFSCFIYWHDMRGVLSRLEGYNEFPEDQLPKEYTAIRDVLEEFTTTDVSVVTDKLLMQGILSCSAAACFLLDIFLILKYTGNKLVK